MATDKKQLGSPPTSVEDITDYSWSGWFMSVFQLLKDQKKITSNQPITINVVSNTQLKIQYTGTDGVTRSNTLTLT